MFKMLIEKSQYMCFDIVLDIQSGKYRILGYDTFILQDVEFDTQFEALCYILESDDKSISYEPIVINYHKDDNWMLKGFITKIASIDKTIQFTFSGSVIGQLEAYTPTDSPLKNTLTINFYSSYSLDEVMYIIEKFTDIRKHLKEKSKK